MLLTLCVSKHTQGESLPPMDIKVEEAQIPILHVEKNITVI